MQIPDYRGNGIVNLMQSIVTGMSNGEPAFGAEAFAYPPHPEVPASMIEASRHVVLLVIDGLGYDYLRLTRPGGALSAALRKPMTSVFPSTTTSAITTFLTAEAPQQHALTGWYMWSREIGVVMTPLPFKARFGDQSLGSFGVDPKSIFDRRPVFDRIDRQCFMLQPSQLAGSAYTRAHLGRATVKPYGSMEDLFASIPRLAAGKKPTYTYAYWPELDTLGHRHGMQSEAASRHLAALDEAFSILLDKLAGRGVTLIVTADHGFVDTDPSSWISVDAHPALEAMLAVPLCGEPRAAYCYVHPDRREDFESYVSESLSAECELIASKDLIEVNYFGFGMPHPRLRDRVGDYCLLMKGNHAIRDRTPAEGPAKPMVGVHGGTSSAEMRVPLVLASV
jgi:predicted AlkP superfamily pyrophosphatase or phosphodiesterase